MQLNRHCSIAPESPGQKQQCRQEQQILKKKPATEVSVYVRRDSLEAQGPTLCFFAYLIVHVIKLMEMFFPLIRHIIVLQKRFDQFKYELGKSICRIYFGLLFFSNFIHFWFAPSFLFDLLILYINTFWPMRNFGRSRNETFRFGRLEFSIKNRSVIFALMCIAQFPCAQLQ